MPLDKLVINVRTTVLKFHDPSQEVYSRSRLGEAMDKLEEEFRDNLIEKRIMEGNLFLNEGINLIWTAVCGGNYTPFNSNNAYIGVGDGTTPASPNQTGLQGANKYYKGMDSGYPIYGTNQKAVFRATFGGNEANFTWNEWTVANGPSDDAVNLNRKVENLGTKSSGSTWILQVELSIS